MINAMIGQKIKELRKNRSITQEKLAEHLGVSFQSVSKWENGITMPDLSMFPAIAIYFGVSIDTIFGFDLTEQNMKIKEICEKAYKYRESNHEKAREILENGLKSFPNNDVILNNLLYVVVNDDEKISLAEKLISETDADTVKYDALRFLAYAYGRKGEKDYAKAIVERIPELYFTKLGVAAYIYDGKEKFEAADKQKWISFQEVLEMMFKIHEYYLSVNEIDQAKKELADAVGLLKIMNHPAFNDDFLVYFEKKLEEMVMYKRCEI